MNFHAFEHFGIGVACNYFELDVTIDKPDGGSNPEAIYDGTYVCLSVYLQGQLTPSMHCLPGRVAGTAPIGRPGPAIGRKTGAGSPENSGFEAPDAKVSNRS